MRFVAVEYTNPAIDESIKGYLRIPEDFPGDWYIGFLAYLRNAKSITGDIEIYPLNIHTMTPTDMGVKLTGYTNMEDDFNMAIRSIKYYPSNDESDAIRRAWSKLDPMCPDYTAKER